MGVFSAPLWNFAWVFQFFPSLFCSAVFSWRDTRLQHTVKVVGNKALARLFMNRFIGLRPWIGLFL